MCLFYLVSYSIQQSSFDPSVGVVLKAVLEFAIWDSIDYPYKHIALYNDNPSSKRIFFLCASLHPWPVCSIAVQSMATRPSQTSTWLKEWFNTDALSLAMN
jgi:hypothetical protein